MTNHAIEIRGLEMHFGGVKALRGVDMQIPKGKVTAIIGDNGAGKSTTMKMIVGYLQPDHGTISLNGLTLQQDALSFKKQIGYLPESNPLYDEMYVKEYPPTFSWYLANLLPHHPSRNTALMVL